MLIYFKIYVNFKSIILWYDSILKSSAEINEVRRVTNIRIMNGKFFYSK